MKFHTVVTVNLKSGVLDPQGQTISRALSDLGFRNIVGVKTGRLFRLEIDAETEAEARQVAEEAAARLLANPVIEGFDIEVVP
jgi:phosphoribosylformylglycinamidine synthase PurS subunit